MTNKENLLAYVAELYYKRDLSQKEIASIIGVSRPTVSRLIESSKEQGIVNIIINSPVTINAKLSNKIRKTFKLKDAIVVEADYDYDKAIEICGKETAHILCSYISNNTNIGITWGRALSAVSASLTESNFDNVHISQMTGCMKVVNNDMSDGYAITQTFAKKLNATYTPISAPLLVKGKEVYNFLSCEPLIHDALESSNKLDITIIGAAPFNDTNNPVHKSGYQERYALDKDLTKHPVASVIGRFLDIDGNEIFYDDIYPISTPYSSIVNAPVKILLNATAERAEATLASLNAKLANILIIDVNHAKRLLEIKEQSKK